MSASMLGCDDANVAGSICGNNSPNGHVGIGQLFEHEWLKNNWGQSAGGRATWSSVLLGARKWMRKKKKKQLGLEHGKTGETS